MTKIGVLFTRAVKNMKKWISSYNLLMKLIKNFFKKTYPKILTIICWFSYVCLLLETKKEFKVNFEMIEIILTNRLTWKQNKIIHEWIVIIIFWLFFIEIRTHTSIEVLFFQLFLGFSVRELQRYLFYIFINHINSNISPSTGATKKVMRLTLVATIFLRMS
jgi:hypothetical protein